MFSYLVNSSLVRRLYPKPTRDTASAERADTTSAEDAPIIATTHVCIFDGFGAGGYMTHLFGSPAECVMFMIERVRQHDLAWQRWKVAIKDLLFDLDRVPTSCADKSCFVRVTHATLQPAELLLPGESLHVPRRTEGPLAVCSPTWRRVSVQTLLDVCGGDDDVRMASDALDAFRRRRVLVYNSILDEIRTFFNERAETLWMMVWHSSAGRAYDPSLSAAVQEMRAFACAKDDEFRSLFGPAEECEAFMADRDLICMW